MTTPRLGDLRTLRLLMTLAAVAACSGDGDGSGADGSAAGLPTSCDGTCATTDLTADFDGTMRSLTRAHFGINGGASPTLYIEAYAGGPSGCPDETSAAADITFVLGNLPAPDSADTIMTAAGLIDLEGALLPDAPTTSTSDAEATAAAYEHNTFVALTVAAQFAEGTVSGHLAATHCPSLDSSARR